MNNIVGSQSFSVEDIRRVRTEDGKRRQSMNREELWEDIRKGAEEPHRIMERIKQEKAKGQVM